ncbi:MAG: glutathione S-transferase family protein [Cyanobacteriota bacterium]|nr:glutathione S-transferase family protein [Cyanobacteriota bacterium]
MPIPPEQRPPAQTSHGEGGALPLGWADLAALAPAEPDRVQGPTNAQARLRLFGQGEETPRVTLYRDHHAWCPYCQKVWLWLEERRIPYRIRKVTMFCYGEKEDWYRRLVPSGMLPALELDGRLFTESDRILEALEEAFGPLGAAMDDGRVVPLRQLERALFRAWCEWLCWPQDGPAEARARAAFHRLAETMERALEANGGPFFLGADLTTADLVFVPYVERMNASLAYYKGVLLRREHPAIHRWLTALEQRPTYRGTQSDFHTHAHDLPPQMGGCHASGEPNQRALAARIDQGPWPIGTPAGEAPLEGELLDPETSQQEPEDAAAVALARVLKHRIPILARNPLPPEVFEVALRCALTTLVAGPGGEGPIPPAGSARGLRYLRDRVSVPRDMPLHAARRLRQALEATALRDPADPQGHGAPLPVGHRRDQDPRPFLARAETLQG